MTHWPFACIHKASANFVVLLIGIQTHSETSFNKNSTSPSAKPTWWFLDFEEGFVRPIVTQTTVGIALYLCRTRAANVPNSAQRFEYNKLRWDVYLCHFPPRNTTRFGACYRSCITQKRRVIIWSLWWYGLGLCKQLCYCYWVQCGKSSVKHWYQTKE